MTTPKYAHDCDNCRFMGHILGYDVYSCENAIGPPSLIARHGNNGGDYGSLRQDIFVSLLRENGKVSVGDGKTISFHELVASDTSQYMLAWLIALATDEYLCV